MHRMHLKTKTLRIGTLGLFLFVLLIPQIFLFSAFNIPKKSRYNFQYFIKMDVQGTFLLFIKYRFYYEASASVNFIAQSENLTHDTLVFDGIDQTGYVITTGGLRGNSLYFFTADTNLERGAQFREKKLSAFMSENPYYASRIRKIRRRPMQILSQTWDSIQFKRDKRGIHTDSSVKIKLTSSKSLTYSNIYEILGEMILAYNHSFLPDENQSLLNWDSESTWESVPLDFTRVFSRFASLASEGAKRHSRVKQKKRFKMHYKVIETKDSRITIDGESFPGVKIMRNSKLNHVYRRIELLENVVKKDVIVLDFRDKYGKGGLIHLSLRRID